MKFSRVILISFVAALLMVSPAFAGKYKVGVGAGSAAEYEGSDDYKGVPVLMFNGNYDSGRYFSMFGTNMKVNLLAGRAFSLGPVLNFRNGREDLENPFVDRMKDIDPAVEAGLFAAFRIRNMVFTAEALSDISDTHEGAVFSLTGAYNWKVNSALSITPSISVTYANDDYMQTYFGVDSTNRGTSPLPNYTAEAGAKDAGVSILIDYAPWEKWGVAGIISVKSLLNDAEDSPIVAVGEDSHSFVGVMATYRWEN